MRVVIEDKRLDWKVNIDIKEQLNIFNLKWRINTCSNRWKKAKFYIKSHKKNGMEKNFHNTNMEEGRSLDAQRKNDKFVKKKKTISTIQYMTEEENL